MKAYRIVTDGIKFRLQTEERFLWWTWWDFALSDHHGVLEFDTYIKANKYIRKRVREEIKGTTIEIWKKAYPSGVEV